MVVQVVLAISSLVDSCNLYHGVAKGEVFFAVDAMCNIAKRIDSRQERENSPTSSQVELILQCWINAKK